MHGDRIVDTSVDTLPLQGLLDDIPVVRTDSIDVIHVARIWHDGRRFDTPVSEEGIIPRRMRPPGLSPDFQMAQLDSQNGSLKALHTVIVAFEDMVIPLLSAPITEHTDSMRQVSPICGNCPSLAVGPEVFARIKAEAGQVTDTAHSATIIFR